MAINFPINPTINDTHLAAGITWRWDGVTWKVAATGGQALSIKIQDEGGVVGSATTINFVGAAVAATINNSIASVDVSGGVGAAGTWAVSTAGIHTEKNIGINTTNPVTPLQIGSVYGIEALKGTFTSGAGVNTFTVDSFDVEDFKSAEYTFHLEVLGNVQTQKLLVTHNDNDMAYSAEYGVIYEPQIIASIGATVDAGVCKVQITPNSGIAGLTTYRYNRGTMI